MNKYRKDSMRITLLVCYIFFGVVHASTEVNPNKSINDTINESLITKYVLRLKTLEDKSIQSEFIYKDLKDASTLIIAELDSIKNSDKNTQLSILNSTKNITELLKKYDALIQEEQGMSFEVWVGILLACVALIVTGLSFVIAILALWGYSNIKKAATESATEAALKKSERLIEDAIASGHFKDLIYTATNEAIYRGILSVNDFPEESEGDIDESL
jgi:hypothetical protein